MPSCYIVLNKLNKNLINYTIRTFNVYYLIMYTQFITINPNNRSLLTLLLVSTTWITSVVRILFKLLYFVEFLFEYRLVSTHCIRWFQKLSQGWTYDICILRQQYVDILRCSSYLNTTTTQYSIKKR